MAKREWCPFCGEAHSDTEGTPGYNCEDQMEEPYYEERPSSGLAQWYSTGTEGALDDGPS